MKKRIASEITALTMPAKTFEKIVLSFISIPRWGTTAGSVPSQSVIESFPAEPLLGVVYLCRHRLSLLFAS